MRFATRTLAWASARIDFFVQQSRAAISDKRFFFFDSFVLLCSAQALRGKTLQLNKRDSLSPVHAVQSIAFKCPFLIQEKRVFFCVVHADSSGFAFFSDSAVMHF